MVLLVTVSLIINKCDAIFLPQKLQKFLSDTVAQKCAKIDLKINFQIYEFRIWFD